MKAEIQIFKNPSFGEIRTAGTSTEPLFCLADVCKVLDLQVTPTKNRLKHDGVNLIKVIDSLGREQNAIFINEQNLYRVIMRSDKPQAESFQDWVCGEVLPSIRKTGGYIATTEEESPEEIMAKALLVAQATIKRKEERLAALEAQNEQQQATIEQKNARIEKLQPKADFADAAFQAEGKVDIGQAAKILKLPFGRNTLFKKLKEEGVLFNRNEPKQKYVDAGYFELTQLPPIHRENHPDLIVMKVLCTQKGLAFISKLFGGTNQKSKLTAIR